MPYCSRCGVEVDDSVARCPLCDAPIQKFSEDDGSPWPSEEAPIPPTPPLSGDERIALSKTITTLGFLIPASVVLTVDWFISKELDWSLYTLISLGAAWMWAIIPLMFPRLPYLIIGLATLVAVALEWGIGLVSGSIIWILKMGMPIVILAGGLAALVTLMGRTAKEVGSNLAGWILIAAAIQSMGIDIFTNFGITGSWAPGWSIVVVSTLLPIAALLLYIHYRPSRRSRLRRYFHV
jgi:hypothetical protein